MRAIADTDSFSSSSSSSSLIPSDPLFSGTKEEEEEAVTDDLLGTEAGCSNNWRHRSVSSRPQRTVLVTGGAGYIGSHTCVELLKNLYQVIVVDNLTNSSKEALLRVQKLTDVPQGRLVFRECDIRDGPGIAAVLDEFPQITSCIHFAGLKAVGESIREPLAYYDTNIVGTLNLLQLLQERGIRKFVASSSATVYGEAKELPVVESANLMATNPYGRTKIFMEEILQDIHKSDPLWDILILRYFNPVGAHPSGEIGEDPRGRTPNNLMPYISQVCVGRREMLSIFGGDYDTKDGTGVRDYIHVVDLAKGHVAALKKLYQSTPDNRVYCKTVNLGTGVGVSVLDLVQGMQDASGRPVPYEIEPRRPGDVAEMYADPKYAKSFLGWKATLGVKEMCRDAWRWQSQNPHGFEEKEE